MRANVNLVDWLAMIAYALVLTGIALYHWRKLKKQDDIFLAGRTMSRWPVAISMYMALFSTNSFVGMIGWLNRPNGTIWIVLQNIGIISAVPLAVLLFPSLFFRLRITTAYEYLERRFNYPVRAFASLFFMSARIMWMSTMLYAASLVVSRMLGWTPDLGVQNGPVWTILLIGTLGAFFAFSGGMHAVIWTDVAQFFIMMSGVVSMATITILRSGGIGNVLAVASEAGKFSPPSLFSWTDDISILSVLLFGFVGYLSNTGSDQLTMQTYLSARSEKEIKASLWRSGFVLKPLSVIFPILGLLTFVYYHQHPEVAALMRIPDDALPVFVVHILPNGIRGLMIAAIISALLSSLEGGMAALSAALQVDLIRRLRKTPISDNASVWMGRSLVLMWGAMVIGGSLWIRTLGSNNNIIQILNIVMYPFVGVLLGIFLLGMLTHRANSTGTLLGAAAGFVTTIAFPLSRVVADTLIAGGVFISPATIQWIHRLSNISNFFYILMGLVATLIIGYAVSWFLPAPSPEKYVGLTRWSMPAPPVI